MKEIESNKKILISNFSKFGKISESKKIFNSWIDLNFSRLEIQDPALRINDFEISFYEVVGEGTYLKAFESIYKNLDQLCFSEEQISCFCKQFLRKNNSNDFVNYFLVKTEVGYAIVSVNGFESDFSVGLIRLNNDKIFTFFKRIRIIAPKIAA
ncbi:MAG: hypothetical protein EOL97_08300 [Spirochaetia bacterium]|nr:hypothetical protein [Spirochaetia bacterium]